jgi:F0F1-type ATP synthase membrane subunit b/b'
MDEAFWVFVSFVLFVSLLYAPAKKGIIEYLDLTINLYTKSIQEGERLCEENIALLSQAQNKRNNAQDEKRKIITHAKNEVKRIDQLLQEQRVHLMHHADNLVKKRYELGLREIEHHLYKTITLQALETVKNKFLNKTS